MINLMILVYLPEIQYNLVWISEAMKLRRSLFFEFTVILDNFRFFVFPIKSISFSH